MIDRILTGEELKLAIKEKQEKIFEYISIKGLTGFIADVQSQMKDKEVTHAINATLLLIKRLKSLRLLNEMLPNKQSDFAITACMIHNFSFRWNSIFSTNFNMKDAMAIFNTRFALYDTALKNEDAAANMAVYDYIFEVVEAQLGENTPVQKCRPVHGQPSAIVAEVLWWYYTQVYDVAE